jgi:hypothetical protein
MEIIEKYLIILHESGRVDPCPDRVWYGLRFFVPNLIESGSDRVKKK